VCPNCGYNNQVNNRFCVRCGVDISGPPPPVSYTISEPTRRRGISGGGGTEMSTPQRTQNRLLT
jgi:hypothetical protein